MTYQLYGFTADRAGLLAFDSTVFTFSDNVGGSLPTPKLTIQTNDELKASADSNNYKTSYKLIVMGQIGPHFKNRAYYQFDVVVKDYCWISTIIPSQSPL